MSAAVAAPVIGSAVGGFLGMKGSKEAAKAGAKGAKLQEKARQEAAQVVSPEAIYRMAEWMYPGLLPRPNFGLGRNVYPGSTGAPGSELGSVGRFGMRGLMERMRAERPRWTDEPSAAPVPTQGLGVSGTLAGGIPGRQAGGPVAQSQPYIVGEQGPEVMVPEQPGTIVPTPGLPLPGGGEYQIPGPGQPGPDELAAQTPQVSQEDVRRPFGRFSFGRFLLGDRRDQQVDPRLARAQQQERAGEQYAQQQYPTIPGSELGGLAMGHAESFLRDPGQLSTIQYERAQEQANRGLQTGTQALLGGLTGMGVDPRSGLGQVMLQSIARESTRTRGEAARQLAEQEESLRRADIQTGMTAYQNFLNQVFGIIGTQAGTVGGVGAYPSTPAINPYQNISQAIATGGKLIGDYYAGKQQPQPQPQPVS